MGLIILTLLGLKYLPGWVKLVWLFHPCVGLTIAKPTFANYIYAAQLIKSYLRERLGQEDIRYAQLDYAFIEGWTSTLNQSVTFLLPLFR